MDTTKLKPFDLEKALAGAPVVDVTNPYREIIKVYFIQELAGDHKLLIIYKGGTCVWRIGGELRMAPKKVMKWLNFYVNERITDPSFHPWAYYYDSKEKAEEEAMAWRGGFFSHIAVPVEIEE